MNSHRASVLTAMQRCLVLLCTALIAPSAQAQMPNRPGARGERPRVMARSKFPWPLVPGTSALMPAAGPNLPVFGAGTLGRLTKWTGFNSSDSFLGNSTIFEDKFGNVGIGTDTPTSRFTVAGIIETTLGGVKFPDGTIQATAATGLQFVSHDGTLRGNGTSNSLLGVNIPLNLTGDASDEILLKVRNVGDRGTGISSQGGDSIISEGGNGVEGFGGDSTNSFGGHGVVAFGGGSERGVGGDGILARGGSTAAPDASGGVGVFGQGGDSTSFGGTGVAAVGGQASGVGHAGGIGLLATGGMGVNGATNGVAGAFNGDVQVGGNLSKGGGSFKIDHPLDPENRYLYHSFVESPDMKNIYDGTVTTDHNGGATITLPEYFGALNRDFRYQLTVIGTFAQAIVSDEIENNQFRIKTSAPGVKVSWQVTGIRQDAYANRHRIPVEEAKPASERGTYIHPDSFDQPEEKNVFNIKHPEIRERMTMRANNPRPAGN